METESETLRAELRRLHALLASTQDKQVAAELPRWVEETEDRLRSIWNGE
jgi:hypothetical protein